MTNIFTKNLKLIKVTQIKRNSEQPRSNFDAKSLEELKQSVLEHGIINPISVRKMDNHYQIIAGERRYRAACMAGFTEIPCVVLTSNEQQCALISLVENIQRCDLDFIEEALAYRKVIEEYGLKQEELASSVGKTQSSIANKLRVLKIDNNLLEKMREYALTERHARALLKINEENRRDVLDYIIKHDLNVAKTEEYIQNLLTGVKKEKSRYIKVVRDVRLFINTINKSLKLMQESGVNAKVDKEINEDFMTYTIVIPMRPQK